MVVSADGKTTAIRITLKPPPDNFADLQYERGELLYQAVPRAMPRPPSLSAWPTSSRATRSRRTRSTPATTTPSTACAKIMRTHGDAAELHLGGVAMIADDMIGYVRNDIVVFGTASFLLAIGMLGYIFRELRWVLIPVLNCGFHHGGHPRRARALVGWKLTVISSNFLALTLILAISINIHLIVRYRELYRERPRTHASQSRAPGVPRHGQPLYVHLADLHHRLRLAAVLRHPSHRRFRRDDEPERWCWCISWCSPSYPHS
jgi:hypothetical protein